jgi:protein phosphatase
VVVQGPGPGPWYGHVMALVGQRFLLTIGGNDGRKLLVSIMSRLLLHTDHSS